MNDIVIAKSASTKYLGVNITHNLNWNQHCDEVCSKANRVLKCDVIKMKFLKL